jgi:tRNA(fMet)-specific endonuclease VapC
MYLLDTNHCSRIIQGELSVIVRLEQAGDAFVSTCAVVVGELRFMVQKSEKKNQNLITVNNFLENIRIFPIDSEVARIYGDFKFILYEHFGPKEKKKREQLKIHNLGFTENDLWIAATAKKNNLIIVSSDADFKRMQGVLDIVVESWYNPL